MIAFDTEYGAGVCICNQTKRKKNLEFPTKCGSEINKEIIGSEAEKSWVSIQSFNLVYIHYQTKKKKTVGVWKSVDLKLTKK